MNSGEPGDAGVLLVQLRGHDLFLGGAQRLAGVIAVDVLLIVDSVWLV
ncbi:hypothetical protein IMZ48_42600 [Candidatus Bathyarchaeota archaeon]|nr:hypothetical protein [Candidatus Bathyarchaeota archaeon]